MTGATPLASPFQLANGAGSFHVMTSNFASFMSGTPDEDKTATANVKQAIAAADAPGAYAITLTFTGGFQLSILREQMGSFPFFPTMHNPCSRVRDKKSAFPDHLCTENDTRITQWCSYYLSS